MKTIKLIIATILTIFGIAQLALGEPSPLLLVAWVAIILGFCLAISTTEEANV